MSEVTAIKVGVSLGGSVQIIKFEYTERFDVMRELTYSGNWTDEEAHEFYTEKHADLYALVEAEAQAEVDRLESLRDRMNGLDG